MRRSPALPCLLASLTLACLVPACVDEDVGGRAVGASCVGASECESRICGAGRCLAPAADEDGDGIDNETELALGTDPLAADTDGDGVDDLAEVGADVTAGDDADGDGKIDAIESATADCDEDGTPDQDDPTDGADPFGVCGTILGDDACLALCTEAAARACVGFEAATCLAECDVFVAESANTEACVAPFDALATCAVAQHGLRCPMSTSRFTSFPDFDEGVCREQLALEACGGAGATTP